MQQQAANGREQGKSMQSASCHLWHFNPTQLEATLFARAWGWQTRAADQWFIVATVMEKQGDEVHAERIPMQLDGHST